MPLLGLAAFLLWQRRRPQALARRFVATGMPQRTVSLQAARRLLFAPGSLSHHFQALRRHHEVPSTRLDVARSLRATLRAGGAVQLQFATQRRLPDYLVMVDRVAVADHQGALADVVLDRFAEEQVPCSGYDFHGDPRRARALGGRGVGGVGGVGGVADLADLAALHGDHPLILFTDAERFFNDDADPSQAQTPAWVDQLLTWPLVVILTPKPRTEWTARERRLQALGFVVLPATPAGIAGLAALLNAGAVEPVAADACDPHSAQPTATAAPLDLLSVRPDRWVRQTAPAADEIDALMAALQAGLGARGLELLGAIAVFPEVRVEVTLWLADALSRRDGAGAPGLDEDLFGRLARLPWLRRGRMPDWLRRALIGRLDAAREAEIRTLCLELLHPLEASANGVVADAAAFKLAIATGSQRAWLATLLAAVHQDEHSALRDSVFLGFVRGELRGAGLRDDPAPRKSVDPLALRTPGELNRLLRPPQIGALEWLAVATTALATALLWQYDAAIGALWERVWEALTRLLQFGAGVRLALRSTAWVGLAAALVLWHVAVLNDAPAPRLKLLRSARVAAPIGVVAAALALPGAALGIGAVALLVATVGAWLLTWLPPRPAASAAPPVQLSAVTRAGGWGLTSIGTAIWLALVYGGYWLLVILLLSGESWDALSAAALPMVVVVHLLAALALGRRLALPVKVALRCAAGSVGAAGFGLALILALSFVQDLAFEYGVFNDPLFLLLLLTAAWGAMLTLWQCGRAPAAWVVALARLTSGGAVVVFGFAAALHQLLAAWGGLEGIDALTAVEVLLTTLCVVAVFVVGLARRGLMQDATGQWSVPQDGGRVPVRSPRLRLLLASGVLLAPASGLVLIALFQPTTTSMTSYERLLLMLQPLLPSVLPMLLLVPALRIAAPELFNSLAAPTSAPLRIGLTPRWVAWASVPLLWLLTLSYHFDLGRFPQVSYLFVPLAAWWAARYGRAGLAPFVIGAAPLLGWFVADLWTVGDGAPGVFVAALIVYRLVTDSAYRDATFDATGFGWRQGLYLLLVAALIVVVVPGAGPLRFGGSLRPYFTLLLLLVGLAGLRSRLLPWALTLGLVVGLAFGLAPRLVPLVPLFQWVWIDYGINDPSVLFGALLALYGPAWLKRRRARIVARLGVPTVRDLAPYLLLGIGCIDVYFGVRFNLGLMGQTRHDVSLLGPPGLLALAFLIGLFDGRLALRWAGGLLALLVLAAVFIPNDGGSGAGVGLVYSIKVLEVAQGALVAACYVALGVQVGARSGAPIRLGHSERAAAVVPATLPQLRFAYMDIVLMVGAAALLALRAAAALGVLGYL